MSDNFNINSGAELVLRKSLFFNYQTLFDLETTLNITLIGMGTVENSTVRFGFRFCFYGSVLSRFPKRFINDISWIRNYAMECVAELA